MPFTSGVLGQHTTSTPATAQTVYVPLGGVVSSVALSVVNKGPTATTVRVFILNGGVTTHLAYEEPLPPAGQQGNMLNLRAIVLAAGQQLRVQAAHANVDFTATGYEQPADAAALDNT